MKHDKYLALLCAALLTTVSACGGQVGEQPETDAELSCREAGYDIGSQGYEDCVEQQSESEKKEE